MRPDRPIGMRMTRRIAFARRCSPRSPRTPCSRSAWSRVHGVTDALYLAIEAGAVALVAAARDRRAPQPRRLGADRGRARAAGRPATLLDARLDARGRAVLERRRRSTSGMYVLALRRARAAAARPHPAVPGVADDRRRARRPHARRARRRHGLRAGARGHRGRRRGRRDRRSPTSSATCCCSSLVLVAFAATAWRPGARLVAARRRARGAAPSPTRSHLPGVRPAPTRAGSVARQPVAGRARR